LILQRLDWNLGATIGFLRESPEVTVIFTSSTTEDIWNRGPVEAETARATHLNPTKLFLEGLPDVTGVWFAKEAKLWVSGQYHGFLKTTTPDGDIYFTLRLRAVIMPPPASPGPATTTSPPEIPPFPSPQTFDILPEIYALVSRFQLSTSTSTDPTISQPIDSLSPKDLPAAAVPIKLKIQKARAAVQSLPDVGRTVEEQEREIKALEKRNESLRKRVQELAGLARQARGEADTGD
jgi:hypothetical protein